MTNNLTYTLCGDYCIPNLSLSATEAKSLGKYGRMRKTYLKEHRPILWNTMILSETLYPHLYEIDKTAHRRAGQIMAELLAAHAALAEGNVREAVAGFGDIFENGHARSGLDNSTRASRTAIGIKADGTVVMFMVDGRQAPYSVGMTMAEVAAAMEDLGCVQAVNLDGGGSSTFATQREGEPENSTAGLTLRCRPSDGYERKVSNTVMVLSTAKPTGQFDHAVVTPNDEVYTPGSTVQFAATGIDAAGGKAEIPAGASWAVLSGNGRIDANGLYTAAGTCGEVEVGLKAGGQIIGQTKIQVQWPDKLSFTNNSVSIDFGQTSDLTFKPTWQGRAVHYKDGDFAWKLIPTYYKISPVVETVEGKNYKMAVTPESINKDMTVNKKTYRVTGLELLSDSDGTQRVNATIKQGETSFVRSAVLGRFTNNLLIADTESSLRAAVQVELRENTAVTGSINIVVGMEPYVIMDFEDHAITAEDGNKTVTPAEEYWRCHVGASSTGNSGYLTAEEVRETRLWIRGTNTQGLQFLDSCNRVVSAEEDKNVRFGQHAFKIGFDYSKVAKSAVASADFGFSGDMLLDTLQPTKLGLWINVPSNFNGDQTQLKAILKGCASKQKEPLTATAHMAINKDGSTSYYDGELVGTASYFQYKSYNADGTVSGSSLSDWAGKGWTWVEADISTLQMPVDMCRAYAIRVTSPPNCNKGTGYIYIDNFQFIYGANTNDVTRPVLESITETSSNTALAGVGSTVLNSGNLTFNAVYSDSELTDKYATGIDTSGIRVLLDGTDYTGKLEINDGSLYLKGMALRNGTHTLTIRLKDFYGNVTTETRTFRVEDAQGMRSAIDILPQPEAPEIGKEYVFAIVNNTGETVTKAELTVDFSAMGNAAKYLTGAKVESLGKLYYGATNNYRTEGAFFDCSLHWKYKEKCPTHYIRESILECMVLKHMQLVTGYILRYEQYFRSIMEQQLRLESTEKLQISKGQLERNEKRIAELKRLFIKIYEDNAGGRLSDERYDMLSQSYETEQKQLEAEVITLRQEIEVQERQNENVEMFIQKAKNYVGIETLDPYALRELVQAIYVDAPDKSTGKRRQHIHIKYDGIGFIPLDELMKKETA